MRGDKLITLIQVLTEKEKGELIQFAQFGVHHNKKHLNQCLETLCGLSNNQKLDDQDLFKDIFPITSVYNDEKLRDIIYFSTLVFKDFIVYNETKSNLTHSDNIYNDFLQNRGLYKLLDQQLKANTKQLQSKKLLAVEDHKTLFDNSKRRYLIGEEDTLKNSKKEIELAIGHLDTYYFAEKLKWSQELLSSQIDTSHTYKFNFLDEVLVEVNKSKFKENQFISVYYLIALFYKKNISKKNYLILKDSILKILPHISTQERRSLIIDLHNYAIKLYSITGDFKEIHEIHEVNVLAINNHSFIKNGKFNKHSALNIANVALRLGKTEWTFLFMQEIKYDIDDVNALHIIEAMSEFELHNYGRVREVLGTVEYSDIYLAIIAKSFLAKTYFMQKEYELLEGHLKAMEQFYRRSKILSDSLKSSNLNFVLCLKKIMKHVNTPSKLTSILIDLEDAKDMAYIAWVQGTMKQLLT